MCLSHLAQKVESCGCFINVTSFLSVKSRKRFGLNMLFMGGGETSLQVEILETRVISGFLFLS